MEVVREGTENGAATITAPRPSFQLEEATIAQLHDGIRAGAITCVEVVQHYIDRAKAYNGVSSMLVTADGAPVEPVPGVVRATAPIEFPTETVAVSELYPDLDQ